MILFINKWRKKRLSHLEENNLREPLATFVTTNSHTQVSMFHVDFSIWYDIVYLIYYYNDECSIYREHMVTIHERMRPLDNQ
jgi:hypothetical protein